MNIRTSMNDEYYSNITNVNLDQGEARLLEHKGGKLIIPIRFKKYKPYGGPSKWPLPRMEKQYLHCPLVATFPWFDIIELFYKINDTIFVNRLVVLCKMITRKSFF